MQSDERVQSAQQALHAQSAAFRAAVEMAYAQVRAYLAAHAARHDERRRESALELGRFASGRVDAGRFAAVVSPAKVLAPHEEQIIRRCAEVMDEVLAHGEALFTCEVSAGGDLRATVEETLAEVGRAFGAALVFQAVKLGTYRAEQHESFLRAFPFRRWNYNERLIAPPLLVSIGGADLQAGVLADFLDGRQKIAIIVNGACTPAPLARLITPGLFVLQTDTPGDLAQLAATDGPGVAALLPASAARFVHDPAAKRLEVTHLRAGPLCGAVGGWSARQQEEELALLRQLAAAQTLAARAQAHTREAGEPDTVAPTPTGANEVDALASWMLAQAGYPGGDT